MTEIFYETIQKNLQKAKNVLMDDYMTMLGNRLDRLAVNANAIESKDAQRKRKTIEKTVDKIEKAQRGLVRWLDYVERRTPSKGPIRVDSHEPGTPTGRSFVLAREEISRAVALGDAFLDDPKTTDREAKGLNPVIDSMEDALDLLAA
jgi:hypothetical protein